MATYVEGTATRRGSSRAWIAIGSVVVLLAAIGGGILIGRATVEEVAPAPADEPAAMVVGQADPAVVAMVDDLHELMGTDPQGFASHFAENGALHSGVGPGATVAEGRAAIAAAVQENLIGFKAHREGDVAQLGNFVFNGTAGPGGTHVGAALYELTPDGQILNMWTLS